MTSIIEHTDETLDPRWPRMSRTAIQEERKTQEQVAALHPPALSELEAEEIKLAHQQEQLEGKRSAIAQDVRLWNLALQNTERLEKQLAHAHHIQLCAKEEVGGIEKTIIEKCFRGVHHLSPYNRLAGIRELITQQWATAQTLELAPKAIAAIQADIDRENAELIRLAIKNDIIDKLPPGLQAQARKEAK